MTGLLAAACSGPASFGSPGALPNAAAPSALKRANPGATPIPFSYLTVDDASQTVNAVVAINNAGEIVGNVGGTPNAPLASYTALPPYGNFPLLQYTAKATIATSISNAAIPMVAGYMVSPPQLRGTWAFVIASGVWEIFKDRKEGKNSFAITQILGINDSDFGAGFYVNPYGNNVPVVVNLLTEKFNVLKPPGYTSADATGINNLSHIVGWEQTAAGVNGFFLKAGTYYSIAYPGASATKATSINSEDLVGGYYQDSSGLNHGFILTSPTGGSQQTWQTIDEPNAAHGTFVTGINDNDDICGYYIDANNVQHGFVAIP